MELEPNDAPENKQQKWNEGSGASSTVAIVEVAVKEAEKDEPWEADDYGGELNMLEYLDCNIVYG